MALSFHRSDNKDLLFILDDTELERLAEIFDAYTQQTGLAIDPYGDSILTSENQKTLIRIIDKYVLQTDLNRDKQKTAAILELRGVLKLMSNAIIDLKLLGD